MDELKEFVEHGNEFGVKKWLTKYKIAMVDADGNTPLHYACTSNKLVIVEYLLKKNADPNTQDAAGWTPFHAAASDRNYTICEVLLKNKADPTIKNNSNSVGFSYLARAETQNQEAQLKVLEQCLAFEGVDINTRNNNGETILHTACLRGTSAMSKFLIEKSCDINSVNVRGENALHYAVRSGNPDMVKLLLENSINPNQASTDRKTPLDEAVQFKIQPVIEVLQEATKENTTTTTVGTPATPWKLLNFRGKSPSKRNNYRVCLLNNKIWLFGGALSAVQYSDEIHSFSLDHPGWELNVETTGSFPQAAGHSISVIGDFIFHFGGRNSITTFGTLSKFDVTTKRWSLCLEADTPRCFHSCSCLPDNKSLFLFGGSSRKGRDPILNTIDIIDTQSNTLKHMCCIPNAPSPRIHHASAVVNNRVYIFGGKSSTVVFEDLFYFDLQTNTWTAVNATGDKPGPTYGHVLNSIGSKIYLFGGYDATQHSLNKLYVLQTENDEFTWKELSVSSTEIAGVDSINVADKIYYFGWSKQFEILVLATEHLKSTPVNQTPWKPSDDTDVNQRKRVVTLETNNSNNNKRESKNSKILDGPVGSNSSPKTKDRSVTVSKKAVNERIEKLETFSFTLCKDVLDLIKKVELELEKSQPFAEETSTSDIQNLCSLIQEFCVINRPPRTWAGSAQKREIINSLPEKEKIFPKHHYEALNPPPKRITPPHLEKRENLTEEEKLIRNRNLVVNEIITTETDYVRDLAVLIGLYLMPLREEYQDVVGKYEVKSMFKNVEELWDAHNALLQSLLEEEQKLPHEQKIGGIFLNMEDLSKYDVYCANQQSSTETYDKLAKENVRFVELVNEIKNIEESNRQSLNSYLLKPFQRITRYPLLLKELLKQTPTDWTDHKLIEAAIVKVDVIVKTANETKRVNDKMTAIFEIQDKLIIPPENPELSHLFKFSFIYDLAGMVMTDPKKGKTHKGNLYLFKEMILGTKCKGAKIVKVFCFPTKRTSVKESAPSKYLKFPLEITYNKSEVVFFGANTIESRTEFCSEFRIVKAELSEIRKAKKKAKIQTGKKLSRAQRFGDLKTLSKP